jgi:acyl dehydratase
MAIGLTLHNAAGELVQRAVNTIFIRGQRSREAKSSRGQAGEISRGDPILHVIQRIDPDQTIRYAEASGDRNPIHLDEDVARTVGLPGIIVHGLCTMAFVARVIVEGVCGNNPDRLKRLSVQFSRAVRPGDTIETTVWSGGEAEGRERYLFETRNAAGHLVIRDGMAESIRRDGRVDQQ